jgi:hypothetical protein
MSGVDAGFAKTACKGSKKFLNLVGVVHLSAKSHMLKKNIVLSTAIDRHVLKCANF